MNTKNLGYMIAAGALIEERVEVPLEASRLQLAANFERFEVQLDGEAISRGKGNVAEIAGPFEAGQVLLVRVQNKTNAAASFDAAIEFVPMTDSERIDKLRKKLADANERADGFQAQLLGLNRTLEADQAKARDVEREFAIKLDALQVALVGAVDKVANLPGGDNTRADVEALRVEVVELKKENAQLRATVERVEREATEAGGETSKALMEHVEVSQKFEAEAREAFAATAEGLAVLSDATANATAQATALEKRLEGDAEIIAEQFTRAGIERQQLGARCEELEAGRLQAVEAAKALQADINRVSDWLDGRLAPVERRAFVSRRDLIPLERRTALLFKQVFGVDAPLHPAVGGPELAPPQTEPGAQEGLPFEREPKQPAPMPPPLAFGEGGPETPRSAT